MIDIDVSKALKKSGETFKFKYEGTPEFEELAFVKPLALDAEYSSIDEGIMVKGEFDAMILVECTRCLKPVEFGIAYSFDELYVKYQKQDDSNYTYSGEVLQLDKLVYDAIVLSIPQQLLCDEACKGLCQICGVNWNDKTCKCNLVDEIDDSNPFAKLKNLFDDSGRD